MPTTLEVYEKIKNKLDADVAKTLIEYIQEAVEKGSATKEDLLQSEAKLSKQITDLDARITHEIYRLESRLYLVAAVLLGFILLSNPEGFQKSLKFLFGLFG